MEFRSSRRAAKAPMGYSFELMPIDAWPSTSRDPFTSQGAPDETVEKSASRLLRMTGESFSFSVSIVQDIGIIDTHGLEEMPLSFMEDCATVWRSCVLESDHPALDRVPEISVISVTPEGITISDLVSQDPDFEDPGVICVPIGIEDRQPVLDA